MKRRFFALTTLLFAGLAILCFTPGCESDDEFDHDPPAGQGSIIIDNFTYTDIEFYLNGLLKDTIKEDHDTAYDLAPGVYRVVLNDEDGDRSWAADVDVLEGRLTILTVTINVGLTQGYSVSMEIQ